MPGTIEQREQAARELRTKNMKDVFELPEELRLIGNPVRIFNVAPFRHIRNMGSYGQWTIHPCEPGEPHSISTNVPYITNDPVHIDMNQMAHRHDSGKKLALDIIGVGQFHTPGEDLTKWGVFVAEGELPTAQELKKANQKFNKTCDELIREADTYWNQGPQHYVNITDMHRMAAFHRGQKEKPWARDIEVKSNCSMCGEQISPIAAICPHCKNVIDEARVIAAKLPGYEHLWKKKPQASGDAA